MKLKNDSSLSEEQIVFQTDRVNFLSNTIGTRDYLQFMIQATKINLESRLVSLDYDTISFSKLVDKKNVLFFIISENSCPACVDIEIEILNKKKKEIGVDDMFILAYYNNLRYLKIFANKLSKDFKILRPIDNLGFPEVLGDIPFMFLIDSSKQMKFVYLPEKTMPNLSEQYYNFLNTDFNINK